jgi:hypothetical protein
MEINATSVPGALQRLASLPWAGLLSRGDVQRFHLCRCSFRELMPSKIESNVDEPDH